MMPVFIFCWLFCVVLPRLSEGSTCSSGTVGFNPGTYYPQDMTDRMCRYQCLRYTNSSLTYVGITQSTVCFCLTNVGSAVSGCNASCSGNTSVVCGDFSGKLFNTYKMPCPAVVSAVINGTNANKASTVYVSVKCSNGLSDSGTMQLDYDTQYPLDTYVYNSTCPSNWSLNYAYHQPGTALIASLGTSSDGDYSKSGTVTQLRRFVGVLSSIPIKYLLINVTQTMQVYATVLSSATLNVLLGNGNAKNSILTDSTNLIVGQSGTATGQVDTSNVWLMPTLTVTKNYTLIDVRLQLAGAWSAAGSNILFIQVYRQACPVNQFYCTNSSSCVNTGSPCKSPNKQVSQSNCNSGSRYSLSAKNCINTSTNAALVNGGPPNSMTGNYYLQFDIPVNLTSATRLSTSTGEYFVSLADKDVIIQPNDVLAVYQPDSSSYVVATGSGQALTMQTSSITSWASRTGSAVTVQSYPSVTLPTGLTAQVAVAPLVKFTLASTVNVSVTFAYTNHSCAAAPVGCYAEDLYNMTISVANSVSSANTSNTLHVQIPIGGLNFTQSSVCSTFVYCNFSVNPHIGSLPLYQVSFGDYQGNVTNMSYAIQTRAQHFYTLAGTYTTTLTGFNALTSQTVQQTVLLQDVIAGLQIYATQYPVGTIGQPILFVVTVAQGSNATFSINFGDGSAATIISNDPTLAPVSRNYTSFFVRTSNADLRYSRVIHNVGTLGVEECARLCLQSVSDSFVCQHFAMDSTSTVCNLYNQKLLMIPTFGVSWQFNTSFLYALQNNSCSANLLQTISYYANATTGVTANIALGKSGWTASSSVNQSVMFAFSGFIQLNVLRIKSNNINSISIWLSNDTFTWNQYLNSTGISTFAITLSSSVSYSLALNPAIFTRFLLIKIVSSSGNPAGNFDFAGCPMQASTLSVNHTYSGLTFNMTKTLNVSVSGNNLVSSASVNVPYTIDVAISNLTLICTSSSTFIFVNNTLSFRVSGTWGSYLELLISRQDGVIMVNQTYTTYKPFYDFNITFWEPNLWFMTVTASNYVGQVQYSMDDAMVVIQLIPAGCNVPYVDLLIPNACVPGKTCDTSYPAIYNPAMVTRSSSVVIKSNTTNYCPRTAIFTWSIAACNVSTDLCVDYTENIKSIYNTYYPYDALVELNGTQLFTLIFKPRVFVVGLYKFTLNVTIPGAAVQNASFKIAQVLWSQSSTYISVIKSPLIACVNNQSNILTGPWDANYVFTLDSGCSSDPDLWPTQPKELFYYWTCHRSCETAPTFDTNSQFVTWTNATPRYATTCPSMYPTMDNRSLSTEGCFSPFGIHKSGPLTPLTADDWNFTSPDNFYKRPGIISYPQNSDFFTKKIWAYTTAADNSTVSLLTYSLFYNIPHYFILTVGKKTDLRRTQTMVTLLLNSKLPPAIKISCIINCNPTDSPSATTGLFLVDPNASFKLYATVLNFDYFATYYYSWTLCNTSGTRQKRIDFEELTNIIINPNSYALNYSWTHASTNNNASGMSLDGNFPLFTPNLYNKLLAFIINVTVVDNDPARTAVGYILFVVNTPPTVSDITVYPNPKVGLALTTEFSLYCTGGYSENTPNTYSLGYTTYAETNVTDYSLMLKYVQSCTWVAVNQRVCAPQAPVKLPSGNDTLNYTMFLCVGVTDVLGSTNYTFIPAMQVLPVQLTNSLLQSASNESSLGQLAINNPTGYQAYASAVLATINAVTSTTTSSVACSGNTTCAATTTAPMVTTTISPETFKGQQAAVGCILTTMTQLPTATTTANLQQYADLAQTATQNSGLLMTDSNTAALNVADSLSSTLYSITSSSSSTNAQQVENIGSSIISSISSVRDSSYSMKKSVNQSVLSSSESSSSNHTLHAQSATIDKSTMSLASGILVTKVPGEKMTVLNGQFGVQVVTTNALTNQILTTDGTSCTQFKIGSSVEYLFSKFLNDTPATVQLVTTQSTKSQYLWLKEATEMNKTQSMSFVQSGVEYNVTNATGSRTFEIWLDTKLDPTDISTLNVNTTPYTLPLGQFMLTHKVFTKANTNLFINIQHYLNWTMVPVNITVNGSVQVQYYPVLQNNASYNGSNIEFIIYVQKDKKPTDSEYLTNCTVPNFDVEYLTCAAQSLNMSNVADPSQLYNNLYNLTNLNYYQTLVQTQNRCSRFSNSMMNPWTCMITSERLNNTNDSTYYVGVRAIMWNWTLPVENGTFNPNITSPKAPTSGNAANPGIGKLGEWMYLKMNYTFFAYYSGCFYYDYKIDDFSSEGCTIGKCSSPYATQCFCTHLTSFSNLFRLPKISFDITSLNINALNNSPGVMCFLVAVICAYFIIWIWARHADLEAEEKVGVVYLPDNDSRDQYAYEITVWTGNMPGSGTSANVSLILAGDSSETDPRWLCDSEPSRKSFQRGSVDMFLLTTNEWLGTLSHLRVWHDNTGKHPSWYLLRVLVRDIYTDTKYYFIVNTWFSATKDIGVVDRLIPVAGKQELRGVTNVLWTRAPNKLFDGHLWLSVATRPTRSRFTRVQRLTCCLVMCLTSVLFNLLGYIVRLSANEEALAATSNPDPPILVLGPITLTAYTLTISVISAACTIPINMLIVLLFQQRGIRGDTRRFENPYSRYKTADLSEQIMTDQAIMIKEEEEREKLERNACTKCCDGLSNCLSACVAKILPFAWWSHYVAYTLAFIVTVTAFLCSAILAYSNLPQAWQQESWLSSIILTLLQSIFIIQPLQIFLIVMIFALIIRLPEEDQDEMSKEISIRRPLIEIPSEADDVPRTRNVAKPPPFTAVTQTIRESRKQEDEMQSRIINFAFYLLSMLLMFIVLHSFVSPWRFNQFENAKQNLVLQAPYQLQSSVSSVSEIWGYINVKILPAIYSLNFSANVSAPNAYRLNVPTKYTPDGSSYILGARLRQLRIATGLCTVPNLMSSLIPSCLGEYSFYTADAKNYLPGWVPTPTGYFTNVSSPFMYSGSTGAFGAAVQDAPGASGAGYVANLSSTLQASLNIVANLSASGWIDYRTRVVYIEFLAFNPSTFMYTVGYNELRLRPTGIQFVPHVYPLWLNRYDGPGGSLCLISQVLALIGIIVFVVKTFVSLCSNGKKFWSDTWEVYDLVVSLICILTIILYAIQVVASMYAENLIKTSNNQFANLQAVCGLDTMSLFLIGLIVFLMDLRLLKYIRVHRRMLMLIETVASAGGLLMATALQLLTVLVAFTSFYFLVYYTYSSEYATFGRAIFYMFTTYLYAFDFAFLHTSQPELGMLMYSFFVSLVVFIFMRGFIPILAVSLHLTREKYRNLHSDPNENPINYVSWKCQSFFGCAKPSNSELMFDYIAGAVDYEELYKTTSLKFDDLTRKFKNSLSTKTLIKAEEAEAVKAEAQSESVRETIILAS